MSNTELTSRILAGLALGEDPAKFMSFRIMPDLSVVAIDSVGRKFILTRAELDLVRERVVEERLRARGRGLIQEIGASLREAARPEPASAKPPAPEKKPASAKPPASKGKATSKPKPSAVKSPSASKARSAGKSPSAGKKTAAKPKTATKPA